MPEKAASKTSQESRSAVTGATRSGHLAHSSPDLYSPHKGLVSLQRTIGNQAVNRLIRNTRSPSESGENREFFPVPVGKPDDRFEREVDRMADRALSKAEPKPAGDDGSPEFGDTTLKHLGGSSGPGSGESLRSADLAFFESRFAQDLSGVRVHTDPRAEEAAQAFHARAFTVGRDIVFGRGEYNPSGGIGRNLLAHELAHVVQQETTGGPSGILHRKPNDEEDEEVQKRRFPIKVPRDIQTEEELDQYAEVLIFGKVMNFSWHWDGKPLDVKSFAKEGKTINYVYPAAFVSEHGGKKEGEDTIPGTSSPEYNKTKGTERKAINSEINRRYWEMTGVPQGETIKQGEQSKIDMWNIYRDEVMAEKKKLKALPPEIKALMGGESSFRPLDYTQLLRIADKLKTFSPEDLTVYRMLALRATDDLDLFEKSVDMFLARKAELKKALDAYEAKQKGKDPDTMEGAMAASWSGVDLSGIGKMSEADRYELARRQTWEVTQAQLEYMKNHPGETAVDFAKTATLMNTGETFEGMGRDIAEAASGDADAWARWAGGVGAGAKLSGWLLAVGGVLYVASWLTGVGELATIAAFMGAMLASTIVLSTAESELRIKAASKAQTPEEFKAHVTKAAAARTNVLIMVGLLVIALAVRFVAKTYFPETVAKISKTLARFREKVPLVGKLAKIKKEFAAEMETHRQKLVEAGESAKESAAKQAEALDKMTLDQFIEKLEQGSGDFFQEAAVQKGRKIPWKALAETPEGLKAISEYKAQLSEALRTQVPKEIDAMVKEQVDAIDAMLKKAEKATIPDEFEQAVREHEKFLSEEEVVKRGKAREEQVRREKIEEAEKALEQEIKRFELARKKAKELLAAAEAERETVTADLTALAEAQSGEMVGLDKAVKSEGSLTRKISDRVRGGIVKKKGIEKAIEASAGKINDALRFTMILDPVTYVAKIRAVVAALEAKGYTFVRLWNGWTRSGGTYMGANATFKTPKGQLFELQFHTKETFKIKSETHHLYEQSRSRVTTAAEKAALDQQQKDAYKGIKIPPEIETLEDL